MSQVACLPEGVSNRGGQAGLWITRWSLVALITSSVSFAEAQLVVPEPGPTFDVVSVKVNKQGGGPYPQALPGRLILTYYSAQDLVALA
jgi:hypothetical protein